MRGFTLLVGLGCLAGVLPGAPATAGQQNQSVRVVTVTVTVEDLEPSTRGLKYR